MRKFTTKATLLPLVVIDKNEIPENREITDAYKLLREEMKIGTQYDWLARYAYINQGVELGAILPDGEFSGVRETINKYAGLLKDGDTYRLDLEKATKDCKLIFGYFDYPLVFTKETDMVQMIKEWGCEDVMALIWFCHSPIKGRICGFCRPCEQKMDGNMEFLLPIDAQRRYKQFVLARKILGDRGRNLMYRIYRN